MWSPSTAASATSCSTSSSSAASPKPPSSSTTGARTTTPTDRTQRWPTRPPTPSPKPGEYAPPNRPWIQEYSLKKNIHQLSHAVDQQPGSGQHNQKPSTGQRIGGDEAGNVVIGAVTAQWAAADPRHGWPAPREQHRPTIVSAPVRSHAGGRAGRVSRDGSATPNGAPSRGREARNRRIRALGGTAPVGRTRITDGLGTTGRSSASVRKLLL